MEGNTRYGIRIKPKRCVQANDSSDDDEDEGRQQELRSEAAGTSSESVQAGDSRLIEELH